MTIPFTLDRIGNQYRCVITDSNGNSVASDYGELRQADNNWTFTYDANGMRTSRTNGVSTYTYVYNGGKLSKMHVLYHTMEFTYDADGKPFSLIYNGDTYYYVTNIQGDVVAIVGSGGTTVVRYTYDAWGRVLTITGGLAMSIGHLNPLRYRGYVYDHDTKLYYLQSRYYDPELGRFINADQYPSTGQGLTGNNMFAYCGNNPVSRADSGGELWNFIIGGIVGGVVSALTTALTNENASITEILFSGAVGAIGGAVAASGLSAPIQAAITAGATFIGDVATQVACEGKSLIGEDCVDYGKAAWNSGVAAASSLIGSAYGSITSAGYMTVGNDMVEAGTNKLLTGYVRQSVGQSHSKLLKQGRKLVEAGTKLINTGKGISSVTGTLLTFGAANKWSK